MVVFYHTLNKSKKSMRKQILAIAALFVLVTGCNKSDSRSEESLKEETVNEEVMRSCAAQDVLEEQMNNDPSLRKRMNDIEAFTKKVIENPAAYRLVNGIIEIPVVFNVLYKANAENISQAQLQSQIDILNQDFAATNTDYNNTPALFQGARSGSIGVQFVLDAVNRKKTNKASWAPDDAMKFATSGGINATSPTTKLNIWVVNKMTYFGQTLLGYAQFPGGAAATDGVVLVHKYTGNTGTATAPYNKGRTATHEVGHWLNLRHIWGDANCGTDEVADTPQHNTSNGGCPTYPHLSTCAGTPVEMTMNYMDYTYDACMYMFTAGQKARMQAVFASGGPRNSFAQP
jgi:Pregnancy-associated plasma protein-A